MENIFIHIPKTGGTTLNCVIQKTAWQTTPDFHYRHIIYDTKRSNSKDIFNPSNYDKYLEYNLFTMLRNPVDRMISEYYFMKDRAEFMNMLKPKPRDLLGYIKHRQTRNYMVGFLVGNRMYDEKAATRDDLDLVLNTIDSLGIKVGIFEEYAKSLAYFSSITGIKVPRKVEVKRITLNRPPLHEVSQEVRELIQAMNPLDMELYEVCKKKFDAMELKGDSVSFDHNKYNYILKYTQRFNLLELRLKELRFLSKNKEYFESLNLHFHKEVKLTSGEDYVASWNATFRADVQRLFPDSPLSVALQNINEQDSLEETFAIADALDVHLKGKDKKRYAKGLIYDRGQVKVVRKKKGFFASLFS